MALAVRAVASVRTVIVPDGTHIVIDWILDAFATAIGVLLLIRILDALGAYVRLNQEKNGSH